MKMETDEGEKMVVEAIKTSHDKFQQDHLAY